MSVIGSLLVLETFRSLAGLDDTLGDAQDEVAIEQSEVAYVAAKYTETVIRGRPWVPFKRLATVKKGTRFVVRGEVESRDKEGCKGEPWYALYPIGFVCSRHVTTTDKPPDLELALPVAEGRRLPHTYALVREDGVSAYKNREMAELGVPDRSLTRGMSIVVRRSVDIAGERYIESKGGMLIPRSGVGFMGEGSTWRGVSVDTQESGPLFAWVYDDKTPVFAEADKNSEKVATLKKRDRVYIQGTDGPFRKVGPTHYVHVDALNEVIAIDPPEGVLTEFRREATGNDQWIDVDVGEQVLVAYRGDKPVYATLISSGRGSPTPLGNYPIWAKVASMDMSNQDYEDKPYMVQGVPWVLLFQGHNALHGAYWHNRFGRRKSHGCVNLAPLDARWVFEWSGPSLPAGWTGLLPADLQKSVVVHVRDSSRSEDRQFTQQRKWGPPDRAEEDRKLAAAQKRREEEAARLEETIPADTLPPPGRLRPPTLGGAQ